MATRRTARARPGQRRAVPPSDGTYVAVFVAEFNPIPAPIDRPILQGRRRQFHHGRDHQPFVLGASDPVAYSWKGNGWIEFRNGKRGAPPAPAKMARHGPTRPASVLTRDTASGRRHAMLPRNLVHAMMILATLAVAPAARAADTPGITFEGGDGPGKGKNIVLIAADDEYRSEESIPSSRRSSPNTTASPAPSSSPSTARTATIDPGQVDNIPGLRGPRTADLLVLFARFRELPDDQMKHIVDYTNSGRPIVALRTSTHPFNYSRHKDSPYAKYSWQSNDPKGGFGRLVFGETWVSHYGDHQKESTRGTVAPGQEDNPDRQAASTPIWGPSDVYGLTDAERRRRTPSSSATSSPACPPTTRRNPTESPSRSPGRRPTPASGKPAHVFVTTMGHAGDFPTRTSAASWSNACYWSLGMEDQIPRRATSTSSASTTPPPSATAATGRA